MSIKLEIGKTYRTRDGLNKVTIAYINKYLNHFHPAAGYIGSSRYFWTEQGSWDWYSNIKLAYDLVEEVPTIKYDFDCKCKKTNNTKSKPSSAKKKGKK